MIISRAPFRVSFFGGGTDYPEYFREHGGAVLGTAINKGGFMSVMPFRSKLFDYNIRLAYSKVECVQNLEDIVHGPYRECLRRCGFEKDIELSYTAELPSFSGLGTSSTFLVSLLNALHAYSGRRYAPMELAYQAIDIERNVLGDAVGCQDQAWAALGGFGVLEFRAEDDIVRHEVPMSMARLKEFEQCLMLFFTGIKRRASEIASRQIKKVAINVERLQRMRRMVDKAYDILAGGGSLAPFGELLHESWALKRGLDSAVSNDGVDELYRLGREAGALGGKLLGAGGGGFVCFFVPPERREAVRDALKDYLEVKVRINAPGTEVLYHANGEA